MESSTAKVTGSLGLFLWGLLDKLTKLNETLTWPVLAMPLHVGK